MKKERGVKFPLHYFDIVQELGGLSLYYYVITLLFFNK